MRVAYRPELLLSPVIASLSEGGWDCIVEPEPGQAVVEGRADIALTPALDYGRYLGVVDYGLLPEFAILAGSYSSVGRIAFRTGQENLSSIVVSSDLHRMARFVARVVLTEKHGIEPTFVEVSPELSLADMLELGDGVLLWGDASLASRTTHQQALDLADEWEDLTELPLPYALAWGNRLRVEQPHVDAFRKRIEAATLLLPDVLGRSAVEGSDLVYQDYLAERLAYQLPSDSAEEVLHPLFQYAFFHGVIEDMPTVKFLPIEEPEEEM